MALPHEAFSNGNIKNWRIKAQNYFNFTDFLDFKNLWNCNVMKFKTMREEKTISSLLPWGRKWFFPPSWSQISWHCNFTSFSDKRNNFFFPVGLLLCPLGNVWFLIEVTLNYESTSNQCFTVYVIYIQFIMLILIKIIPISFFLIHKYMHFNIMHENSR